MLKSTCKTTLTVCKIKYKIKKIFKYFNLRLLNEYNLKYKRQQMMPVFFLSFKLCLFKKLPKKWIKQSKINNKQKIKNILCFLIKSIRALTNNISNCNRSSSVNDNQ